MSPVGELYGFLTPPIFTLLIILVFIGFIFLIRETSGEQVFRLPKRRKTGGKPLASEDAGAFALNVPATADVIRVGLISGEQVFPAKAAGDHDTFTLQAGLTRPVRAPSPSRLPPLRCKPDLNFHLDRLGV